MTAYNTITVLAGSDVVKTSRADLNNSLAAAFSLCYSDDASEPSETWPGQLWADASAGYLKQRFHGDDGWHVAGALAPTDDGEAPHVGVLGVYVTKEAEGTPGANQIRFTFQVTDLRASASALVVKGRKVIRVIVAATTFAAPGGTQTVAVTQGTLLKAHTADQLLEIETDSDGIAKITVEVSGSGDRFVRASVGDSDATELQGTWV